MTLTLVAVYAPLAFTPGRTGRLFIEFRTGAGRRGGGVGLHRADPVADDVLAAAPGTTPIRAGLTATWNCWLTALTNRYQQALTWLVTARYDRSRSQVGCGPFAAPLADGCAMDRDRP